MSNERRTGIAKVCPQCASPHIEETQPGLVVGALTGPSAPMATCRSCGWKGEATQLRMAAYRQQPDPIVAARYEMKYRPFLTQLGTVAEAAKKSMQVMGVPDPRMLGETHADLIESLWRMGEAGVVLYIGRPINEEARDGGVAPLLDPAPTPS